MTNSTESENSGSSQIKSRARVQAHTPYRSSSRRIAKNTLMLYFRQILIMLVSLYTVRVVLAELGAEDYGIYNVVAGVVTMFGFLSGSMASAFQRYLTFDIAKNDSDALKETFAAGLGVFIALGIILLLFFETAGLWFVRNKLVIPEGRMFAAQCVYHASVISFAVGIALAPYSAMMLANEDMSIFALASIVDAVLKLLVVFVLAWIPADKLAAYGFLMLALPVSNIALNMGLCFRRYPATRTRPKKNWARQKEMLSYSGWNLFGSSASAIRNQGVNILMNLFFGPAVNAARAVASQVSSAVTSFSSNFSTALRPQIIKEYAVGNKDGSLHAVCRGCRICFFLLWIPALPILLNAEKIFSLWLKIVPDYTVIFTALVVADALIECTAHPLVALMHAHGKIRGYQIAVGGTQILNLPLSYFLLRAGFEPQSTMVAALVLSSVAIVLRLVILQSLTKLPVIKKFTAGSFFYIAISAAVSFALAFGLEFVLPESGGLVPLIFKLCAEVLLVSLAVFFLGFSSGERKTLAKKFFSAIKSRREKHGTN